MLRVLKQGQESVAPLAGLPEPLRDLDVTVLHTCLFEILLSLSAETLRAGGHLRHTEEVERAMDWVDAGEGQAAFLLNATRRQQLMTVAEAGLQMPPKSTYFYPKVLTGLVLNPLDPVTEVCRPADASQEARPTRPEVA